MPTTTQPVTDPVTESDEDSHRISQTALTVVLFAPRQVRRGVSNAKSWLKANGRSALTNVAWFTLVIATIIASVYLSVGIVMALWHLSPVLVYGLGVMYLISALGTALFYSALNRSLNDGVIDVLGDEVATA